MKSPLSPPPVSESRGDLLRTTATPVGDSGQAGWLLEPAARGRWQPGDGLQALAARGRSPSSFSSQRVVVTIHVTVGGESLTDSISLHIERQSWLIQLWVQAFPLPVRSFSGEFVTWAVSFSSGV